VRLSTLVGRQRPIVDAEVQTERTVAASSGMAPADVARILSASRHVQRARQIFRFAEPPTPMTIPVPSYVDGAETTVQVDYVGHVLDQLVDPTTSAEEQVARILKIRDVLGGAFVNWRVEVFDWYDFLATFFALNQKYSAAAMLFEHLHKAFQTDYDGLGDFNKNRCLSLFGTTIPFRLGTVLFKAVVDICESLREVQYPGADERRKSMTVAGEEITPMVLVIDLESIHSPLDASLQAEHEDQGGFLESFFGSGGDKGFTEEQRKALAGLRAELMANPLALALYYRLASAIIRYHGRIYVGETTWQDYMQGTTGLLEGIMNRCRGLAPEMTSFPDFKAMYLEVMKAKRVRQKGVGAKSAGILDRLQGRSDDLRSRYERRMDKLITDLSLGTEDETVGVSRLEQLFVELDLHQELSDEARTAIAEKWAAAAAEHGLSALAARTHHLRATMLTATLPADGLTSRFGGLAARVAAIAGALLEAVHLYERFLARNPEPAVQEHLVAALEGLGDLLTDHHGAFVTVAGKPDQYPLPRGRHQDLLNPVPVYMKELALLDELDPGRQRCLALDERIGRARLALGIDAPASAGPVARWTERIEQILARLRHTGAGELDCIDDLTNLHDELLVETELADDDKSTVVDKWTEFALKERRLTVAGRNEHLRVRLLMATLPAGGDDAEATHLLNQQLLTVFSTLTDACALLLQSIGDGNPSPALCERLHEAFVDTGDVLVAFKENYEQIAEHPGRYEVTRQQLSDLRDPLVFFIQARKFLAAVPGVEAGRLEELDWKIKEARKQI